MTSGLLQFGSGGGSTPFGAMGALSGGGSMRSISISNDGVTKLITTDEGTAWIWNNTTNQWDNVLSQDRLPSSLNTWGQAGSASNAYFYGTFALQVAPSNANIIYCVLSGNGGGANPGIILRSSSCC